MHHSAGRELASSCSLYGEDEHDVRFHGVDLHPYPPLKPRGWGDGFLSRYCATIVTVQKKTAACLRIALYRATLCTKQDSITGQSCEKYPSQDCIVNCKHRGVERETRGQDRTGQDTPPFVSRSKIRNPSCAECGLDKAKVAEPNLTPPPRESVVYQLGTGYSTQVLPRSLRSPPHARYTIDRPKVQVQAFYHRVSLIGREFLEILEYFKSLQKKDL